MIAAPRSISLRNLSDYARDQLAAALAYPRNRLARHQIALPGLDLDLWSSDEALAELCRSRLVHRDPGLAASQRATVFAIDATVDGWPAPAVWDTETGFSSRDFEQTLAKAGLRGFYHHDGPSWQFYDPAAALGVHTLPSPMGIPPWEQGSPLRLFLHWAYASGAKRLTHAAAIGVNGRGALIVGASGSGKSGTTLAALMNGLTSVGDDYVVIEPGPKVTAHAVFRIFKQDESGLRRAGLTPDQVGAGPLNWHGKYEFDTARLKPDAFVERLTVHAILLPMVAHAPQTTIEPISASQAALALAPSAVFQLPGDTDSGFVFFAKLARQLPAFRVRLSEDPAEIADAIGTFLAGAAHHVD
jgi:hypothetical protein